MKDYLDKIIVTGPVEQEMTLKFRAFAKWWLDLARSITICAFLLALGIKSESTSVLLLAIATCAALVTYVMSYMNAYSLNLFPGVRRPWLNYILFSVGTAAFISIPTILVLQAFSSLLIGMAGVQMK